MCVRCGCVLCFKGVCLRVHKCLCLGLGATFEECRGWTQPSKSQKRVVTGRSSERKHLRCTSKPTSATRGSLLCPQAAEPLERPAAAEPLERPASAGPRERPAVPAQCTNAPGSPLTSEQKLSGITRWPYKCCSPTHCATTAGGGAQGCTWSLASTCARSELGRVLRH